MEQRKDTIVKKKKKNRIHTNQYRIIKRFGITELTTVQKNCVNK